MASSTVSSWMIGSCMSVPGKKEHELHGFFGIYKSKCKWAIPSKTTKGVFINSKSNSALTFPISSSFLSQPNLTITGFSSSNSCFLFTGSAANPPPTKIISYAQTGEVMAIASESAMEAAPKKKPPTKERRVVVTGMGVATSVGHDPHTFYENLLEGVSGISEIEAFDCSQYPTRIAGEIKSFSTDGWIVPKLSKRMDKFMLYMLTAGKKALSDGGITEDMMDELDKRRCGVLIGSAMGGMKVFNDAIEALRVSYRKMNPFCVPFATTNMGSAMLAMDLGWMGPNYSISTACATSNFCILNAANHIIRGEADMMLCGGSDAAIIPIGLGGFVACRALSQRNTDPSRASRPWDSEIQTAEMNAETLHLRYSSSSSFNTRSHSSINGFQFENMEMEDDNKITDMKKRPPSEFGDSGWLRNTFFMRLTARDVFGVVKNHPIPCIFATTLLFFMGVEYTLHMVPSSSPPFDLGFVATRPLHRLLDSKPALNTVLAGLNTGFVGMQMVYIVWAFLIEGRPRATIATLFMFTCRGILGYSTQLPLPEDFLGSGADFPVGNVSFFLFYSGHVAASVIASLDMKRMQRWKLSYLFDTLNVLQTVRLLSTRGHYTIDLAVGVGAGILFDSLSGKYEEKRKKELLAGSPDGSTNGAFHNSKLHENGEYLSVSAD